MELIKFGGLAIRLAKLRKQKAETERLLKEIHTLEGVMHPRERLAYLAHPEGCMCQQVEGKGYCGWCDAYYSGEGA